MHFRAFLQSTEGERALALAQDYLLRLRDRGDRSEEGADCKPALIERLERKRERVMQRVADAYAHADAVGLSGEERHAAVRKVRGGSQSVSGVADWERRWLLRMAAENRVLPDGRVRGAGAPEPWTLARIRKTCPELSDFRDHLAVLILADGVLMNDDEIQKAADLLVEVVHKAVAQANIQTYGRVLAEMSRPGGSFSGDAGRHHQTVAAGKRGARKCSKCKEEGHQAPTCPKLRAEVEGGA